MVDLSGCYLQPYTDWMFTPRWTIEETENMMAQRAAESITEKREQTMLKKIPWGDEPKESKYKKYKDIPAGTFFVRKDRYEGMGLDLDAVGVGNISIKTHHGAMDIDGYRPTMNDETNVLVLDVTIMARESKNEDN